MFVNNEARKDGTKRVYILGDDEDRRSAERAVKEGLAQSALIFFGCMGRGQHISKVQNINIQNTKTHNIKEF